MASDYPGGLDSFDTIASDKKTSDAVGGRTHRAMHNDLGDAIEAVQSELGTDPSGGSATVKARFEAIEANDWVTAARIAADAVGSSEIAANAVGSSELADNAVDTAAIATGAVTAAKILIGAATVGSGTGTPEGVVTAAPGSTWLQTDSTTDVKGWIKWVKATGTGNTGWVAGPEADTGWRDVTASVTGTASGSLYIRRTGNVVTLRFSSLELNAGSGAATLYTFATGFKVITSALGALRRKTDQTKLQHIWVDPTDVSWQAEYGSVAWTTTHPTGAANGMTGVITYTTTDAWPSSLPGSAA